MRAMDKLTVIDDQVVYRGVKLGKICADFNELKMLTPADGVAHAETPYRIDILMAAGDKVVGIESKKPTDLVNSFNSRRLARQFSTLLAAVDVPVLLKRGVWPEEVMTFGPPVAGKRGKPVWWHHDEPPYFTHRSRQSLKGLWAELARWQMLGGIVIEGPGPDHLVPAFLETLKPIFAEEGLAKALAGSDYRKGKAADEVWALLRGIPGIGPAILAKIQKVYPTPWQALLDFQSSRWDDIKISERVRLNVQRALDGKEVH